VLEQFGVRQRLFDDAEGDRLREGPPLDVIKPLA
jgi:hypothetical protein